MLDSGQMAVISTRTPVAKATAARLSPSILLALLSGFLLNLPFPIAGPLPPWRAAFGWIALVPLMYALLAPDNVAHPKYLRRSALTGYVCGIFWYILNCYWIYHTMHLYGGVPAAGAAGIVVLYSMVLGLYFGLFGAGIAFLRRTSGGVAVPLVLAPFLWVAIELAASRITSVPWDQLGYSQVDNFLLTRLAPWTGVYGISFVLMAVNALFVAALLSGSIHLRLRLGVGAALAAVLMQLGSWMQPRPAPTQALAVLLQANFDVRENNDWVGPEWDRNIAIFLKQSEDRSAGWYAGMPDPSRPLQYEFTGGIKGPMPISLIAWPEAPSPFTEGDLRFQAAMKELATSTGAGIVAGDPTAEWETDESGARVLREYNSASFISPEGEFVGRYNKIHLVPFGEYVPYRDLFFFAHHLTRQVGDFARGKERNVFTENGHRYGVFICYESIFADEIRQFVKNGAEVFVNISDDGWYGDTSAPWQHLNMARMRAIENRRWLLRDTNSGVTASIDPYGRVVQSSPRHVFTSLPAMYGFRDDLTFYTRYGDVFGWACVVVAIGAGVLASRRLRPVLRKSPMSS
ncbi:MAG TPA: apolipoprotein N-acyltransferase [Silvibacterium sp.]|nr:apolipoprotein N-acyltransferase [Silvibacterium sp.]